MPHFYKDTINGTLPRVTGDPLPSEDVAPDGQWVEISEEEYNGLLGDPEIYRDHPLAPPPSPTYEGPPPVPVPDEPEPQGDA
jgi:hypothetical protein